MLKDRLSPADEAAREKEMREELTTCPRILDLVARGPLADPGADAVVYLRSPLDPAPVTVSNDHLMGCVKAAENYFRAQGIDKADAVAVLCRSARPQLPRSGVPRPAASLNHSICCSHVKRSSPSSMPSRPNCCWRRHRACRAGSTRRSKACSGTSRR
jgi:hypothetical protein